jgi:hypothetical protein
VAGMPCMVVYAGTASQQLKVRFPLRERVSLALLCLGMVDSSVVGTILVMLRPGVAIALLRGALLVEGSSNSRY